LKFNYHTCVNISVQRTT